MAPRRTSFCERQIAKPLVGDEAARKIRPRQLGTWLPHFTRNRPQSPNDPIRAYRAHTIGQSLFGNVGPPELRPWPIHSSIPSAVAKIKERRAALLIESPRLFE